jgi:hypothetical protein
MVSLSSVAHSTQVFAANRISATQNVSAQSDSESVKVSLNSWVNDDSSEGYPQEIRNYLTEVKADPTLSDNQKNALFFNLVLRPKSEARLGGELAQAVVSSQDPASWKQYLSSLQYLSVQNEKNDTANAELHKDLTAHYQKLSSRL